MRVSCLCGVGLLLLSLLLPCQAAPAEPWPQGFSRSRDNADTPFILGDGEQPAADVVLLADSELVANAADWLAGFVKRTSGSQMPIGGPELLVPGRPHVVAAVGEGSDLVKRLTAAGLFRPEPLVGPQGFVVERVSDPQSGELLLCWSPEPLGCRYGLIEVLRSLRVRGRMVRMDFRRDAGCGGCSSAAARSRPWAATPAGFATRWPRGSIA